MPTTKAPKQVKVSAKGCKPDNLELFTGKDTVVFVQSGTSAPATVSVNSKALFGTTTCKVAASLEEATVYALQTPGNYVIGLTADAAEAGGDGTVQVLCLGVSTSAMGAGDSGTIKVTR